MASLAGYSNARLQRLDIVVCLGHVGNKRKSSNTSKSVIEHVNGIDESAQAVIDRESQQ